MPMYDFTGGGSTPGPTSEVGDVILATEAPNADWLPLDGSEYLIGDYPTALESSTLLSLIEGPIGDSFITDHTITLASPAGFAKPTQFVVSNKPGDMTLYFSASTVYKYSVDGGVTWQDSTVSFPKPMVSGRPYIDGSSFILLCDNERAFYRFDPSDFSCTLLFDIFDNIVVSTPVTFYEWIRPDIFIYVSKDDASTLVFYELGKPFTSQYSVAPPTTVGSAIGMSYLNGSLYYTTDGTGATILGNIFRLSLVFLFGSYRLESVNITYKMPNTNVKMAPATIVSTDKSVEVLYTTNTVKNTSKDGETFVSDLSYAITAPRYFRIYGTSYALAYGADLATGGSISISFAGLEGDPSFIASDALEAGFETISMTYSKLGNYILHSYSAPGSHGVSKIASGLFDDSKFRTRYVKSPTIGLSYFVKGK